MRRALRLALGPHPAPAPAPASPQSALGDQPRRGASTLPGARCRAVRSGPQGMRRPGDRRRGEPRPPYLHQLPPVLPRNSFFSEFQMNFFQPPSSLAFPRAMVAGQQLPRGCSGTAACALGPLPLGAGRDLRRLHPPLPLRRSECQTRRGGAGARARGGRRRGRREGPRAGRLRAPHLLVGTRPLTGSLWSTTRSSCPWSSGGSGSPQLPLLLPPGTRTGPPPPVTSAETAGAGESQREGRTNGRAPGTTATPRAQQLAEGARSTFTI